MTREELIEKVNEALSEEFETPKEDMLPDAPMMEVLDLDSLDIVDVVVLVEKHFGFVMKKEDFRGIKSFADFYDFENPHTALLRENNGDMTSTRLQRYSFDISWHTMLEAVRIHEKKNPLLERDPDEVFPDL